MGNVKNVSVCPPQKACDGEDMRSQATVNTLSVESVNTEHTTATNIAKQRWLVKLMKALTIHVSNLSFDQMATLMKLVEEYSDIFALDTTELEFTNLVTCSINTGDIPSIRQPVRHIPFALHTKMEH